MTTKKIPTMSAAFYATLWPLTIEQFIRAVLKGPRK
jgi:hypothetical protein